MNYIAKSLKDKNIAEYLIYMWQEEDIIRSNDCNMDKLEKNVISIYPNDKKDDIREWYSNLTNMMIEEGVREKGHIQINNNVIIKLTDLHNQLCKSSKFPYYTSAYYKALPYIVELRNKNGNKEVAELHTCFEAIYGMLLLKVQKKQISSETITAVEKITNFVSMLANYYEKEQKGELNLE